MGSGLIYQHLSRVGPNILASPWGGLLYWHLSGVGQIILASKWGGA